jgi:hypothetical protein
MSITAVPISILLVRADGGEQREGRGELAREMMHAEIRAVRAKLFGGDGKIDGLQQRVGGRACLRMRRRRPVAEGEKADFLHGGGTRACAGPL